jgi:hypothetical protein
MEFEWCPSPRPRAGASSQGGNFCQSAPNFHSLGTGEDPDDLLAKLRPDDIDFIAVNEAHRSRGDQLRQRWHLAVLRAAGSVSPHVYRRSEGIL